jgi:hypothetical protein
LSDAAELVDDERRERLALDVLGDDRAAACPVSATFSSSGSRSFTLDDLLLVDEDVAASRARRSIVSVSVTK